MIKITNPLHISDRIRAHIWVDAGLGQPGTFVLARDARLRAADDSVVVKGCFAAYLGSLFEIDGAFAAITLPGVAFGGNKVHTINALSPGDLSYIDGCSNSNVISPPRNGDPCSNYLFFPPGIEQTFHSHPSFRLGIVLSGNGTAWFNDSTLPLEAGDIFYLPRFEQHRFTTGADSMSLLAFHPDSDGGPLDDVNPMKTRTYV